ncbi:DNA replication and repair protein RecF, partial [Bienertia sinuspersici]
LNGALIKGQESVRCLLGDATIYSLLSGVCPGVSLQKEFANPLNYDFRESDLCGAFCCLGATRRVARRQLESNSNVFDSLGIGADSLLSPPLVFRIASFGNAENALNSSVDKITSTLTNIIKDGNETIEKLTAKVLSSFDEAGELTCSKLNNVSCGLKQSSKGSKFVYYSYETSKEFVPPDIQNALKLIEEKASDISRPVGMVFIQVYSTIEGLERSLGLDRSDLCRVVYWLVTYSGYAGDLFPKMAFELLSGKDSVIPVDDLRQQDGILDLR